LKYARTAAGFRPDGSGAFSSGWPDKTEQDGRQGLTEFPSTFLDRRIVRKLGIHTTKPE
jgi:hypothetical protein